MALIEGKFIADDAVDGGKFKLDNDQFLRGRNNADNADVDILKVTTGDALELAAKLSDPDATAPTADAQLANKKYVDDEIASAVAGTFSFQGSFNATTGLPALSDGAGTSGHVYRVTVAGTQDFGSGNITFEVGDKIIYEDSGVWAKYDVIDNEFATSDTDDLAEGASNFYYTEGRFDTSLSGKSTTDLSEGTNLYFTDVRVEDATLSNYVVGADAALANTDDVKGAFGKIQGQINALATASTLANNAVLSLDATDISNGYKDLAHEATTVLGVSPLGGVKQELTVDYTLSVVSSVTRITFAGDLASLLANGDKLLVDYLY